jgi:prolyl oligopeptidase
VAVSLSRGGSELGDLHFFLTETGEQTGKVIERVNAGTAGGDVAWTPDGSGFYYTRYPRPGERPEEELLFHQEVWYHAWGTPLEEDRHEIGREATRIAEFRLQTDPGTGRVLATVQDGDSGRFELHLRDPGGNWKKLCDRQDRLVQGVFAPDGSILAISRLDAPRGRILRLSPPGFALSEAREIVAESEDTIVSYFYGASPLVATEDRLYVTYQLGGPSTIRCFDHRGTPLAGPDIPPVSRIGQIAALGDDSVMFSSESYLEPPGYRLFAPGTGETLKTDLMETSPVDFSDTEAVREYAESADGTRIPVNILRPVSLELDGSHPVLLTGYGGFGVSLPPFFNPTIRIWIEQGGIFAVANLRGGGEFGEDWHRDGMLTRKQNVFDDFAAAMRHMIDAGYTTPERLAISGGSNGGLLMGAMITQHPRLSRAVVSSVGIYDMLRVELSPNGSFNIPEYGTVADPDQFRALHAYSPYHRDVDGEHLPAVLFLTGANDPRVDPMQSRKMTAKLQAASSSGLPILLRTSSDTGHGRGTPLGERIEEMAHRYAFLFHQIGIEYRN